MAKEMEHLDCIFAAQIRNRTVKCTERSIDQWVSINFCLYQCRKKQSERQGKNEQ